MTADCSARLCKCLITNPPLESPLLTLSVVLTVLYPHGVLLQIDLELMYELMYKEHDNRYSVKLVLVSVICRNHGDLNYIFYSMILMITKTLFIPHVPIAEKLSPLYF